VLLACLASPARAQQRPLVTEDPENVGEGKASFDTGVETGRDVFYGLSGLHGDRVSLLAAVRFGLGRIGELEVASGYQWLQIDRRDDAPLAGVAAPGMTHTTSVVDATVATKVRVLSETARRPALGVRFATRLPNAGNESGLGLDTTDVYFSILSGKTIGRCRVAANVGLGILGDPLDATSQKDQFTYGVSVTRPLTDRLDLAGEVAGRAAWFGDDTPGLEPLGEVRGALRYVVGNVRLDAGMLVGFTTGSPEVGVMAGLTVAGKVGK
jgi:hypothetical protein